MNIKTVTALEYCKFVTDGTHDSPKVKNIGFKLITSKHLKRYEIDFDSANYISEEDYKKVLERSSVEQWDILFSMIGTIGNIYIETNQEINYACKNMGIFQLGGDKMRSKWLYYYLQSPKARSYIESVSRGTTQGYVPLGALRKMPVDVVDDDIRNKIVTFLWELDEKIKANIAINNNLFEQMQALYKAWFVDFKPFGGVRPSNWNDTNIYAIANIIYGAPFASKLFNTDGLGKPIIRIRDLKEQAFVTFTTEEHPKGHLIQPGDIVVGMDGEFRPYIWGNEPAWLNQRVCIFESNRPQGKAFVLYTIKPLLNKIEQTQVATTVIHIGKKDFDAFEIILPDESTLDSFDSITAPMIEQIVNNRLQNKRLAVLRDTLLPKLMSGELDVSNIEI